MGNAVWIPIDTTFQESDFVDSGQIRLGGETFFQPQEVELLDYRLGSPG